MSRLNLLLINPSTRKKVFQNLSEDFAAVEPPYWIILIAEFIRRKGFSVKVLDAEAENLDANEISDYLTENNPSLTVFIVYGHQPSASTQSMTATSEICRTIKADSPDQRILIGGTHAAALPERTLKEEEVDFVCDGEGPHTIYELLKILIADRNNFSTVPGLWYKEGNEIKNNPHAVLIQDLDRELPTAAWDLLPMNKYRAHNWHCFGHINERQPYASIYTSFGCPFSCIFCCIQAPFGKPGIRYRNPKIVVDEIGLLVEKYAVKNIKFIDEMFVLKESHVLQICDLIIERGYDLNIWAYSRVDTINDRMLEKLKKAGFNWLALGIESGSKYVRNGVTKDFGKYDIKKIVDNIHQAGIHIVANFIFGLPDDNVETMQETLNLAMELNCAWANFYSAMAYPGSGLYKSAIEKGIKLSESWVGYSQYAYEALPLPTDHISASEVLAFRDRAFDTYYTNPDYLSSIRQKFGEETVNHLMEMNKTTLKRKYA